MIAEPPSRRTAAARVATLQAVYYAALGLAGPFTVIYYKRILVTAGGEPALGLLGLLIFLGTIAGVVSLPVAGVLADRFKVGNRLLTVLSVLVAIGMVPIALVGMPLATSWPLGTRWLVLLVGVVANGLFIRPIVPIIDTETLSYLHVRYGGGERYGRFRLFGTLGWVASATGAGLLLRGGQHLEAVFLGSALAYLVLAVVAATGVQAEVRAVAIPWDHLRRDRVFRRFLVFAFLFYLAQSSSFSFTGYFFDDLHMGAAGIGVAYGLAAVLEIPIMQTADFLLGRIGYRSMIMLGTAVNTAKLLLFVLTGAPARPLLMAAIHSLTGIGYPLFWLGAVALMDRHAHRDLRATYQTLNQLVATVGMALAGPFGSLVIGLGDSRWLMGMDAILLGCGALYFALAVTEASEEAAFPRPDAGGCSDRAG